MPATTQAKKPSYPYDESVLLAAISITNLPYNEGAFYGGGQSQGRIAQEAIEGACLWLLQRGVARRDLTLQDTPAWYITLYYRLIGLTLLIHRLPSHETFNLKFQPEARFELAGRLPEPCLAQPRRLPKISPTPRPAASPRSCTGAVPKCGSFGDAREANNGLSQAFALFLKEGTYFLYLNSIIVAIISKKAIAFCSMVSL